MEYSKVQVDEVVAETNDAFLFDLGDCEQWVPKSQIDNPSSIAVKERSIIVEISTWFCAKESIEEME